MEPCSSRDHDDDGNLIKTGIAADMDCDGDVHCDDIGCFIEALSDGCPPNAPGYSCPDCDGGRADVDGDVDFDDADIFGDLLGGAVATAYTWDAENRLIAVGPTDLNSAPDGSHRAEYGYDYLSRRVWKKVYTKAGGSWSLTSHRRFVWDGWLLMMELDGLNSDAVLRKYTWGLDLAGLSGNQRPANQSRDRQGADFLQAAGGIGGLLATYDTLGTPGTGDDRTFVYCYDANGNVGQLIETTAGGNYGTLAVKYEYDPYGGRLNSPAEGEYVHPWRFSTKQWDDETGLGYWGYRYYSASLGRWVSRDPIEERGGFNLSIFVANLPTSLFDGLGQMSAPESCSMAKITDDTGAGDEDAWKKKGYGCCPSKSLDTDVPSNDELIEKVCAKAKTCKGGCVSELHVSGHGRRHGCSYLKPDESFGPWGLKPAQRAKLKGCMCAEKGRITINSCNESGVNEDLVQVMANQLRVTVCVCKGECKPGPCPTSQRVCRSPK